MARPKCNCDCKLQERTSFIASVFWSRQNFKIENSIKANCVCTWKDAFLQFDKTLLLLISKRCLTFYTVHYICDVNKLEWHSKSVNCFGTYHEPIIWGLLFILLEDYNLYYKELLICLKRNPVETNIASSFSHSLL